jgi:flagellar biosynthesis regulator FlbT
LVEGKFLSGVLLLNKHKVIGMTATFRGIHGMNKMLAFLQDSVILTAGVAVSERILALDVHGKLKP